MLFLWVISHQIARSQDTVCTDLAIFPGDTRRSPRESWWPRAPGGTWAQTPRSCEWTRALRGQHSQGVDNKLGIVRICLYELESLTYSLFPVNICHAWVSQRHPHFSPSLVANLGKSEEIINVDSPLTIWFWSEREIVQWLQCNGKAVIVIVKNLTWVDWILRP